MGKKYMIKSHRFNLWGNTCLNDLQAKNHFQNFLWSCGSTTTREALRTLHSLPDDIRHKTRMTEMHCLLPLGNSNKFNYCFPPCRSA